MAKQEQAIQNSRVIGYVYGDRKTFFDQMQDLTEGRGCVVQFRPVRVPESDLVAYLEASTSVKKEQK
jgi:hypothetical protein